MASATVGYQNTTDIVFDMTSDTANASEQFNVVVTRAFVVIGVTVICEKTQAGGTVTVGKGASAITAALACDTANAVVNAATLAVANSTFAVGDTLRATIATAGSRGTIVVRTAPLALGDATTVVAT
jgi:hypothetical protein